ncbi:hypothetical protein D9757_009825 [Collybiopsis confluens]|uniref:Uncharacterized protein n=1 Tax=Collybiopsis confluens TaxID=2823264 RepID=A0A8H5M6D6_9AGAR|nr:hypothetical protein D9757_009825 [Collybiopsis confluens]
MSPLLLCPRRACSPYLLSPLQCAKHREHQLFRMPAFAHPVSSRVLIERKFGSSMRFGLRMEDGLPLRRSCRSRWLGESLTSARDVKIMEEAYVDFTGYPQLSVDDVSGSVPAHHHTPPSPSPSSGFIPDV